MKVKIRLASPDRIKDWAFGKVSAVETLNYRTLKPAANGLFAQEIFGPINNYECACGRYKGIRYENIVCERCSVQVTKAFVRRERMGYIDLPVPVVHPWFLKTTNNKIVLFLNMTLRDLKKVINLENYIVIHPGEATNIKRGDLITQSEYDNYSMFVLGFEAGIGGEALYTLLEDIDLEEKIEESLELFNSTNSIIHKKKYKTIVNLCKGMMKEGIRPEWMILKHVAVLPADLRPIVELDGGQFVSADLNELYRFIVYRSKRLSILIKNKITIPIVLHNEIRILQNAVNKLFGIGVEVSPTNSDKKYKSLEERIKGKEGSLRKSMLGKRVDFSARSVIVVDPSIGLDECVLPKEMALELLKPVVIGCLYYYGFVSSVKQAKKMITERNNMVWDVLNEIVQNRYSVVLLNRAPTLHRIGIMAFYVKLSDKKAIGINPLVCPAFNADFDGDQMAVHLPLSIEAMVEAITLMAPSKNLGSSSHGGLNVGAFKDMAFGLYSLTLCSNKDSHKYLSSAQEAYHMLNDHLIDLNDYVHILITNNDETETVYKTTVGRVIYWEILPKHANIQFEIDANKSIEIKEIQTIMKKIRFNLGDMVLAKFTDDMKNLGFKYGTYFSGSFGKDDFLTIPGMEDMKNKALKKQIEYKQQEQDGFTTYSEMKKKSLKLWSQINIEGQKILQDMINNNPFNPLFMIIKSGARGSLSQMMQILGMKGSAIDISGEISTIPILDGHHAGVNTYDYFRVSTGTRKGVSDVALRTAEAGYLTRRLVDVSHNCIINITDCCTNQYIIAFNVFRDGVLQSMVYEKILNRISALDIIDPTNNKVLIKKGTLINTSVVELLKEHEITKIAVRSPVLCEAVNGICAFCYGSDLSSGELVAIGESVGIIAAQSIGEPGTQLTMRSFHSGGVARFGSIETAATTPFAGKVEFSKNARFVIDDNNNMINISKEMRISINNKKGMSVAFFDLPYGAKILAKENLEVGIGDTIASWSADRPMVAEFNGICEFINLLPQQNYSEIFDEVQKKKKIIVTKHKISPIAILKGKNDQEMTFFLPENTILEVDNHSKVTKGTIIAYNQHIVQSVDIVGGLQKIISILENRSPKKVSILSPYEGIVEIYKDKNGKNIVKITDSLGTIHEILVGDAVVIVQNGHTIRCGDALTTGEAKMQDILSTKGLIALMDFFLQELQNIYLQRGIRINDKHLEIILRQMTRKYSIYDSGDSDLLIGTTLSLQQIHEINNKLSSGHKKQIKVSRLISGITSTALDSESFLSSASFQDTTHVIIDSALCGKEDHLKGIKENVIVGPLIPCGTGFAHRVLDWMSEKLKVEIDSDNVTV